MLHIAGSRELGNAPRRQDAALRISREVNCAGCPITLTAPGTIARLEVPFEGGAGRARVFPAASTAREEMAVSGQRLLAASGQIPMAAHRSTRSRCQWPGASALVVACWRR